MSDTEDEEDILLYVEVNGLLDIEVLEEANPFFKLIALDSDQPIMQIGREVFCGEYRDVLGTAMFFEEDPLPPGVDPVFGKVANVPLRYTCKTNKSLIMNRVFLKDKVSGETKEKTRHNQSHTEQSHTSGSSGDITKNQIPVTNQTQNMPIDLNEDLITQVLEGKKIMIQPKVNEENPATSVINEPMPGPSWATDIPPSDILNILSGKMDASTEEVSRLIAEQMNISSDINLSISNKNN